MLLILTIGCNNQGMNIEYLETNGINENYVSDWIVQNSQKNGIYLGHLEEETIIYIYVNYKNGTIDEMYSVPSVKINHQNNQLIIEALPQLTEKTFEKVFSVNYKQNKIKEVLLNKEKISILEIPKMNKDS